jgi:SAM-dependent methyltransferase
MKICNVCGNDSFGEGPGGRLSKLGLMPRCEQCQSLERHRAFRKVADQLSKKFDFKSMAALQFSKDLAFNAEWFNAHLLSVYGGVNSLDLQCIDLKSESFDIVICNHVIEHIQNDYAGLAELIRIVSNSGFVFLSFPDPLGLTKTRDWGYPDEKKHGHYRIYGADAVEKFRPLLDSVFFYRGFGLDEVTGSREEVWLLTKDNQTYEKIIESGVEKLI